MKEAVTFFEKKVTKKTLSWGHGCFQQRGPKEQTFFAELFYKKATACFP
jgi:hypothetical protein